MPSLVLQAHPVKSAASSTTQSQSCFSHAHLVFGSVGAFLASTVQLAFLV